MLYILLIFIDEIWNIVGVVFRIVKNLSLIMKFLYMQEFLSVNFYNFISMEIWDGKKFG